MNAKESYAAVKLSIDTISSLSARLQSAQGLSEEAKKQWNLCLIALNRMGQLAECLIENCNRTSQIINNDRKCKENNKNG